MVRTTGGALLLALEIDHESRRPIGTQLCVSLRELVLSGALRAGDRLPATRTLASELGVSRSTVVEAFERLAAEGLLESRTGAGTFVSQALLARGPRRPGPARPETGPLGQAPRLSRIIARASDLLFERLPHEPRAFTTALPAFDAFPMALWARHVAKHWRAHRDVVMGYGDARGFWPLRRAIAAHLRTNRAIACEPEEVFVVNGAQQAFQLLADVLLDADARVWFENPGAIGARNCFAVSGAELVGVPVDGEGLMVEEGVRRAPGFRLAFVTPAHQQPLGSTMSLARRLALLAAAEAADAWVIEDDYDGEFCYGRRPPPTLKSIDTSGRVVYVGTFSKTLFPALRLGYVVAPRGLADILDRLIGAFVSGPPSNPQAVLADFMEEGHFATHLRRMRKLYAERQQVLHEAARERLAGLLDVVPTDTGLHTVGYLDRGLSEMRVAEGAMARHITVVPFNRFAIEPITRQGLVLGFSGVNPGQLRRGVSVLGEVLEGLARNSAARVGRRQAPRSA